MNVDTKKLLSAATLLNLLFLIALINYRSLSLGFNYETLSVIGTLTAISWACWILFKNWLWKLSIFQGWLVYIPNLNGGWRGEMKSNWINPETKKGIAPIPTTAIIKQNLTNITIDFETNEMESQSIVAAITSDPHRRSAEISYIYQSVPGADVRNRSPLHYGAAKLKVKRKNGKQLVLTGEYWTGRNTTGKILLSRTDSTVS